MGINIGVQNWRYQLDREPDGRFRLRHHVTPSDGGYGMEVDLLLEKDYFRTHSVNEFYDFVSGQMAKPDPKYMDKKQELRDLKQKLQDQGWLSRG